MTKMPLILFFAVAFSLITSSCTKKVEVSQLQERGKLHYTINSKKPFSGQSTDYYPSGQIKEVINFKKGRPHGPYQSFYKNGQAKKIGTYKVSKYGTSNRHGNWKYYGESGWLGFDTNYNEGDLHGKYVSYYENGDVWKNGQFKDGEQVGEWVENGGPNSKILSKITYNIEPDIGNVGRYLEYAHYVDGPIEERNYDSNGEKHGKQTSRNSYGDITSETIYDHGERLNRTYYYSDHYTKDNSAMYSFEKSTKKVTEYIDGEDNYVETTFSYDRIETVFEYRDGHRYRYDNYRKGILRSSSTYLDGKKYEKNYFENGKLSSEGHREDYNKSGEWTYYNNDGTTSEVIDHSKENDQTKDCDDKIVYFKSGKKKASGPTDWSEKWSGMVQFLNEDGSLAFELEHDYGEVCKKIKLSDGASPPKFTGNLRQYYLNGQTAYELEFIRGRLSKSAKYNNKGIKESEYQYASPIYGNKILPLTDYKRYYQDGKTHKHITGEFSPISIRLVDSGSLKEFTGDNKYLITEYDKNGVLIYKKDHINKTEVRYHKNKQLRYEAEFKRLQVDNDFWYVPAGRVNYYNKNGDIDGIKEYADGKLIYEKYFGAGLLYYEDFYHKNGNRTKRLEYDYTGALTEEILYSKDHRSRHLYSERSMLERKKYYPSKASWLPRTLEQHIKYTIHLDDEGEDKLEYNSHITSSRHYYDNGQLQYEVHLTPNRKYPHSGENLKGLCRFYHRNGLLFHTEDFGEGSTVRKYDILEKMESFDIIGYFSNAAGD